jgi:hypothetical protein
LDIKEQDCRITGYVVGTSHFLKVTHMPTGVTIDFYHKGAKHRRAAWDALQQAVDRHMDNELAKLK